MTKIRQQVALHDVRFFAYHGFYPEEQKIGSVFYVDIETYFHPDKKISDDLMNTLNYERLFAIADAAMAQTSKLIETVAERILQELIHEFPYLERISVGIRKMHPPLAGEVGASVVNLSWTRS
jgi:dihydroneopterin aldolase